MQLESSHAISKDHRIPNQPHSAQSKGKPYPTQLPRAIRLSTSGAADDVRRIHLQPHQSNGRLFGCEPIAALQILPNLMSKAFTKETDDAPEVTQGRRPGSGLPPGATNYLTTLGARRLRDELDRLTEAVAEGEAGGGGTQDRMRYLRELLRTAVVMRSTGPANRVRFGNRVEVRGADGVIVSYRIVGVDEADPEQGEISCISPLARALTNRSRGDQVQFEIPGGTVAFEILSIARE
jgi:transcription elongation factor GreB